jgi:L-lactate dehydrogenase complex protein LldG
VVAIEPVSARKHILRRIANGLGDVPDGERPDDIVVPRGYLREEPIDRLDRFVDRVAEYRATVHRVDAAEVGAVVAARCRLNEATRLAIPDDLPDGWAPKGVQLVHEAGLDLTQLDEVNGALTGCALAVAETGTIVLDSGPRQGRRALTLVPDYHICVVFASQIVTGVPEAMEWIAATLRTRRRPVTLISGPSATSDIELARVEGVHGPRILDVLVAAEA